MIGFNWYKHPIKIISKPISNHAIYLRIHVLLFSWIKIFYLKSHFARKLDNNEFKRKIDLYIDKKYWCIMKTNRSSSGETLTLTLVGSLNLNVLTYTLSQTKTKAICLLELCLIFQKQFESSSYLLLRLNQIEFKIESCWKLLIVNCYIRGRTGWLVFYHNLDKNIWLKIFW